MRYLLTTEQMIENGYPMPSYMSETFEKPPGWVETKVASVDDSLLSPATSDNPRIYAMDCEMVRILRLHLTPHWYPECAIVYD